MNKSTNEDFSMHDPRTQTSNNLIIKKGMEKYFSKSIGTNMDRLRNFTKYVPRQTLSMFLAKHEIFKKIVGIHGHIIECGVYLGGGLMTLAQLSSIYEPVNYVRKVVGFDTFSGFVDILEKDKGNFIEFKKKGGLAVNSYDDLQECIRLYDLNRAIGHIPRVELIAGDAVKTIPQYLQDNLHLVVAMLYLDFDVYEPTKVALETFLPRMPKGAVICFDELDDVSWPGETIAVMETVGLRNLKIERLPFTSQLSFTVLD